MDALDGSDCTKVDSDASGAAITTLFNALRAGQGLDPIAPFRAGDCQSLDATLTPNLRAESFHQDNVSWRAGVDFKPTDDVLLYARSDEHTSALQSLIRISYAVFCFNKKSHQIATDHSHPK